MPFNRFLAQKRIQDARELVAATSEKFQEESSEHRTAYERFYNNLAIFSGGAIPLSITYLGYLKSVPQPIVYHHLLVASWVFFLLCLLFALFYPFFYTNYGHYARLRELNRKKQEQCQTELDELPQLNIADAPSPAERMAIRRQTPKGTPSIWRRSKLGRTKRVFILLSLEMGRTSSPLSFCSGSRPARQFCHC